MALDEEIAAPLLRDADAPLGPRSVSACVLAEGINDVDKHARYIKTQRKLLLALTLAFIFMLVEIAGGIYAHSLAIVTDAAHLLSDVSGFAVSAFAAYYATQKSHQHFSYGYHRIEVLGALASVLSVWLVTGILLWEAVQRIINPEPVDGKVMFIIACVGVVVNIALVGILGGHSHAHAGHSHSNEGHSHSHRHHHCSVAEEEDEHAANHDENHHHHSHDHKHDDSDANINVRGAVIHVLGDLVQSVGVALAGALIWWHQDDPKWAIADPICTFLFAALVLWTTFSILRDISDVLMERAPRGADVGEILEDFLEIEGVEDVHDLHVWSLTPGIPLLCAHVAVESESDPSEVLHKLNRYCRGLGIDHITIQLVVGGRACTCGVVSRNNSRRSSRASLPLPAGDAAV